jgi:hypothetical protein
MSRQAAQSRNALSLSFHRLGRLMSEMSRVLSFVTFQRSKRLKLSDSLLFIDYCKLNLFDIQCQLFLNNDLHLQTLDAKDFSFKSQVISDEVTPNWKIKLETIHSLTPRTLNINFPVTNIFENIPISSYSFSLSKYSDISRNES